MKCSVTFNCDKYSYILVLKHDNANHESVYPKQRRLLAAEIFGKSRLATSSRGRQPSLYYDLANVISFLTAIHHGIVCTL